MSINRSPQRGAVQNPTGSQSDRNSLDQVEGCQLPETTTTTIDSTRCHFRQIKLEPATDWSLDRANYDDNKWPELVAGEPDNWPTALSVSLSPPASTQGSTVVSGGDLPSLLRPPPPDPRKSPPPVVSDSAEQWPACRPTGEIDRTHDQNGSKVFSRSSRSERVVQEKIKKKISKMKVSSGRQLLTEEKNKAESY